LDLERGTVGLLYELAFFGKTVRELVLSALARAVLMLINSGWDVGIKALALRRVG
jgi:hypothetical protein